ncbi:MAG: enoyl-CoA hydratase/isomerase family protein [Ignavibacteriaceae bacterium]|nr:enoyl-CoA hydratase/isomerase family protein [Ignavibacteriaceae bacterium]
MSLITNELVKSSMVITLNRPEKRNALSPEMITELTVTVRKAIDDQAVKSIIITGSEKAFCAGADLDYLNNLRKYKAADNERDSKMLAELFLTIYNSPKPTISAVNGPAIAGGCGLAIVCDFAVAHTQLATFGFTEVRIGFLPAIVSVFLVKRIGEYQARKLLITGEIIHAANAHAIHLVDELSETPLRRAVEIGFLLASNSCESIKSTKDLIRVCGNLSADEAIPYLSRMNAVARFSKDFKSGLEKFLNKKEK